MNIKECQDKALQYINQYSVAGSQVALGYNNQSDYILRVRPLINDAQMQIATTVRRIPATVTVTQTATTEAWTKHDLPETLFHLDEVVDARPGVDYLWPVRTELYLKEAGDYLVRYHRYPTQITSATAETTALDNTIDTHEAVAYYVASGLCQFDDPSLSATLYNQYETHLVRLVDDPQAEYGQNEDVYGGFLL